MRKAVLAILVFAAACDGAHTVDVVGQPQWVKNAVDFSILFWWNHEEEFVVQPGGMPVRVADISDIKAWGLEGPMGIQLDPLLADLDQSMEPEWADTARGCVVAHELGHSLGMNHVAQKPYCSLMAPKLSIDYAGTCCWSEFDQAEFSKTTGK